MHSRMMFANEKMMFDNEKINSKSNNYDTSSTTTVDVDKKTKPSNQQLRTVYNVLVGATIIRIVIMVAMTLSLSSSLSVIHRLQQSTILINPMYTVQHIMEAKAVRQLSASSSSSSFDVSRSIPTTASSSSASATITSRQHTRRTYQPPPPPPFVNAYQSCHHSLHRPRQNQCRIQLPPLVLLFFESWLDVFVYTFHSTAATTTAILLLLFFIDLMIAIQLYQFVTTNLTLLYNRNEMNIMMHTMNPKLYPSQQMLQIFPIRPTLSSSLLLLASSKILSPTTVTTQTATRSSTHEIKPQQQLLLLRSDLNGSDTTAASTSLHRQQLQPSSSLSLLSQSSSPLFQYEDLPVIVSLLYYINPITILATTTATLPFLKLYGPDATNVCFQNVITLLIIHTLNVAATVTENQKFKKKTTTSIVYVSFLLSVLSYIDCHYLLLIIPSILFIIAKQRKQHLRHDNNNVDDTDTNISTTATTIAKAIVPILILFILFSIILQLLSIALVGSRSIDQYYAIVRTTHLSTFSISNLPPNLSLLWYFGMEVFLPFHPYFTLLLGGLPYFTIIPITIRLYKYPSVLVAMFWMIGVLFRPSHNTLYQLNIGLCFMMMNPRTIVYMNPIPTIIAICAIPIPVILYSVAHWMWLEPMNGEANFLYFQCLAYNIFLAILFLGFCSAALRRDKALRMTIKQQQQITFTTTSTILMNDPVAVAKKKYTKQTN